MQIKDQLINIIIIIFLKLFFILNGFREVHAGVFLRSGRPVTDINEKING